MKKWANEWVVRVTEQTDKRVAQYLHRDSWLFWTIVHVGNHGFVLPFPTLSPIFHFWPDPKEPSLTFCLHWHCLARLLFQYYPLWSVCLSVCLSVCVSVCLSFFQFVSVCLEVTKRHCTIVQRVFLFSPNLVVCFISPLLARLHFRFSPVFLFALARAFFFALSCHSCRR